MRGTTSRAPCRTPPLARELPGHATPILRNNHFLPLRIRIRHLHWDRDETAREACPFGAPLAVSDHRALGPGRVADGSIGFARQGGPGRVRPDARYRNNRIPWRLFRAPLRYNAGVRATA